MCGLGPKMKPWYRQDRFWRRWFPVLFPPERWARAPEEVHNIITLLNLQPGAAVLDLCCGPGRHSLELARRGFSVVGVDRTRFYIDKARSAARKEKLAVKFRLCDMRKFCRPKSFDVAICMFTSFGYCKNKRDDECVVRNIYRSLKRNGVFLVDVMGKEVLAAKFRVRDWREQDGMLLLEERKAGKAWSWMESRWIMIKGGRREEFRISHRIYSAAELGALMEKCGFRRVEAYGDVAGAPYDHAAKRLIIIARKGKK